MTRPLQYCPACRALTITYREPNPLDPGDVTTVITCTRCTWDTNTIYEPEPTR